MSVYIEEKNRKKKPLTYSPDIKLRQMGENELKCLTIELFLYSHIHIFSNTATYEGAFKF